MNIYERKSKISDILNTIEKTIKFSLQEKEHNFSINTSIPLNKIILIDDLKLIQICINLLSNAIKYTDRRGKICMNIKDENNILSFEIIDNGYGISKEKQKSVFNTFFTASASGTGLGLCISKMLCKLLGGDLNFVSEERKGSNFFFSVKYKEYIEIPRIPRIPLSPSLKFALILSKDDSLKVYLSSLLIKFGIVSMFENSNVDTDFIFFDSTATNFELKGDPIKIYISKEDIEYFNADYTLTYKDGTVEVDSLDSLLREKKKKSLKIDKNVSILIAEDDTSNREVLESILRSLKFTNIITAEDGLECIRKIKTNKVDILFLDLIMPKLSGYQVLDYLKSVESSKNKIKIIPISASVLDEDIKRCKSYGIEAFVKKPIDISLLKEAIISVS